MTNEEIQGNLASMSDLAHAHNIKVVFSSITPISEYHVRGVPQTTARPMERIKAMNDWMKSYAASHGDVYLDYFSAMIDDKGLMRAELTEDDLHPNAKGYAVMGPLAEAAITRSAEVGTDSLRLCQPVARYSAGRTSDIPDRQPEHHARRHPIFELFKTPDSRNCRRRSVGMWVRLRCCSRSAVIAALLFFGYRRPSAGRRAGNQAGSDRSPIVRSAAPQSRSTLPPLDQTDAVVRELVKKVSSHPSVAAWLATDDLIRHFTIGVDRRRGREDRDATTPDAPAVVQLSQSISRGNDLVIDPRSYARYDTLAAAAASMDADGSARLYATLKPRIEEAAKELGDPSFDPTLERAIVQLLQTPAVDDPIRVEPRGVGYGFADPRLEELTAAQKHLLRTGPRNALVIQTSLRAIALALGIPPERLPSK